MPRKRLFCKCRDCKQLKFYDKKSEVRRTYNGKRGKVRASITTASGRDVCNPKLVWYEIADSFLRQNASLTKPLFIFFSIFNISRFFNFLQNFTYTDKASSLLYGTAVGSSVRTMAVLS